MYRYRVSFPDPGEIASVSRVIKPIFRVVDVPFEVGNRIEHDGREWVVTLVARDDQTLGGYADIEVWPAEA